MKSLSIIIPCYNLENYIEKCLNSIVTQDFPHEKMEIIVVIDSCTDKTKEIAEQLLSKSDIKHTILEIDAKSPAAARNTALKIATGEWIHCIDGDDYLVIPNAYSLIESKIEESGFANTNSVYFTNIDTDTDKDLNIMERFTIWRFLFKKQIIGKTTFPLNRIINEDFDFVTEILGKMMYAQLNIDTTIYHYSYDREGSLCWKARRGLL